MSFPFHRIRHLLIDLDGVVYRGDTALPDAALFLSWICERGIDYRLVTNNATLTPDRYVRKLEGMGIRADKEQVFTSALATALFLRREGAEGQRAYVIGEEGLLEALRQVKIEISDARPDCVIVGLDRQVTYDKLATAALAIRSGARFIGTNPDTSLPTEKGLLPGAGAIQAALTAATKVDPLVIGKPRPLMLQLAMEQLGSTADNTAMLGDRLDTDIEGANAVDMPSILVLTGVSRREDVGQGSAHPTLIVRDLGELVRVWRERTA